MAENNNQDDGIKKLEKRLYSARPIRAQDRSGLSGINYDVKSGWSGTGDIATMKKERDIQTPVLRTLLIFSAIFFLSALGISAYFILGGSNVVSSDNIDVSLTGPISVRGGEDFDLQIIISNKNNIPLQASRLVVEYPEGGRVSESAPGSTSRYVRDIGQIERNSVVNEVVKSVLFGEENAERDIAVTLEYRTEGSNATFIKTKTYKTFISSSPISLSMDLPPDASSGKSIDLNLKLNSNSSELLKDIIIEVAYPSGFVFGSATPPPSYGNNMWSLGDLLAKGERSIHLSGMLQGQDGEVKTFRADAGTRDNPDSNRVSVIYGSSLKSLVVKKPFIGLKLTINGDSSNTDYVANSSETIGGDIEWTNNLPVKVLDGRLSVKINGEVLNKGSVSAGTGIYRSSDGIITWDKSNGDFPQSIEPGQTGTQNFTFGFTPLISGQRGVYNHPSLDLEVDFVGRRFAEGTGPTSVVENILARSIKLSSDLQLTARALYYVGPFKNSGPLPPVHDVDTTYTIDWSVVNSSNDVSGAVVSATLPSYVKWLGNVSSMEENLSYDPASRLITWNIGDIVAGSGVNSKVREVSFQISLVPSITQIGQFPILISDATVSGTDSFTGAETRSVRRPLDIQVSTDPNIKRDEIGPVQ
ncbi:MAG: hypothetical protein HY225_04030 [Candidatus Vogelbacteria bacterium]|nr:hypothetical protein [Candidatus Vogelbacteria bacterium]